MRRSSRWGCLPPNPTLTARTLAPPPDPPQVGYPPSENDATAPIYFDQARFLGLRYVALVARRGGFNAQLRVTRAQLACAVRAMLGDAAVRCALPALPSQPEEP